MSLEAELARKATRLVLASDLRFAVLAWERDTADTIYRLTVEIEALRDAYRTVAAENVTLRRRLMRHKSHEQSVESATG